MDRRERSEELEDKERKTRLEEKSWTRWVGRLEELERREQQLEKYDQLLRTREEEWKQKIREREDELMERVTEWRMKVASEAERIRQEREEIKRKLAEMGDEGSAGGKIESHPVEGEKEKGFKEIGLEFKDIDQDWKNMVHWLEESHDFKLLIEGWKTMKSSEPHSKRAEKKIEEIIEKLEHAKKDAS
ncbi:hypothetical protein ACFLRC_00230 [Candidatus Altiarchaeota archaeon]